MENTVKDNDVDGTVASDLPRGVALLAELATNLSSVRAGFETLTEKIKDSSFPTEKGLSLLELKNQSFLSYMANLMCIVLRKLKGVQIENSQNIERMVEHRVILERLRPLEDKLKYQIDKYIKVAAEGVVSSDDPSNLKGNIDNIGSSSEDDDDDDDEIQTQSQKIKKTGDESQEIYKIPKISQTHYDENDSSETAKERARRRVLNSSMLRDAIYEHTEDPEVVYNIDVLKQKSIRKRKELEANEEDNLRRLTVSKADRASMRQITTLGTIGNEMLSFNSLDPLQDNYNPGAPDAKKQRKGAKSSKGKKVKGSSKGKKGSRKGRK